MDEHGDAGGLEDREVHRAVSDVVERTSRRESLDRGELLPPRKIDRAVARQHRREETQMGRYRVSDPLVRGGREDHFPSGPLFLPQKDHDVPIEIERRWVGDDPKSQHPLEAHFPMPKPEKRLQRHRRMSAEKPSKRDPERVSGDEGAVEIHEERHIRLAHASILPATNAIPRFCYPRSVSFRLLRPHQWAKNAFVLAPLLFAREAHVPSQLARALLGAVLFSLMASAIYCINDALDAPRDRLHPKKRLRPVASGAVTPASAWALGIALAVLSLAGAVALNAGFARVLAVYLALNLLYTVKLKDVVLLDVLIISISFVLRVLAGAAAISVPASHWLLLCTLLLALYLAFSKRRAELRLLAGESTNHRPALVGYTPELLDRFGSILLGATIVAYALYTVSPETVAKFGSDRLIYGLPFVIYGLFRYLLIIETGGDSGEPGKLLFRDMPLLICVVGWVAFNAAMIYWR